VEDARAGAGGAPAERRLTLTPKPDGHTNGGRAMSASDEAVVRRFYEQMCNERKNELAPDIFNAGHEMHDPQVPTSRGPDGVVAAVSVYQEGVEGHWEIEDIFSAGDRVVVRWTGSGTHVGEVNGIPPTGKNIRVDAISIHRMANGKIDETWEVWDTLGFLQQLGVMPG
jgi:predicted ester cyclase